MTASPHVCVERVRWADVDLVGIARYSAFTRFVEHGEQEWLRAAGLPFSELFAAPSVWLPRRQLHIEYLAPARIDEALALITYVTRMGHTSMTFNVDIVGLADGVPRAAAAVVVVCVENVGFTKQPLPDEIRRAALPFHLDRDAALAAAEPRRRELASLAINS